MTVPWLLSSPLPPKVLKSQTSCIYSVQDLFSTSLQVLYFWFFKKNIKNWKPDMKALFCFGIEPKG